MKPAAGRLHGSFTGAFQLLNRPAENEAYGHGMTTLIAFLLSTVRLSRPAPHVDTCLTCGHPVTADDERTRLPGGGWVHRGCASYRQRRQMRIRRLAR